MSYNFSFDLSKMSKSFFKEISKFSEERKIHKKMSNATRYMIEKFNVESITGLQLSDSVTVIEDIIGMNMKNISYRDAFLKTNKRVLLLPHCARKYMDSKCKARFDPRLSSYFCNHCSSDCLVSRATKMGLEKKYDVYVVPGGSGTRKILKKKTYDGIVGVACTEEMKLGAEMLEILKIPGQAVPLIKNGCHGTKFNLKTLESTL